jgi:iron complex transport system substrate-binding protein
MKMKNKILVMVEIAVVLCSVFLVALPAIAADQTTQKTITTASEDDHVLASIYGNANEDDTIDMRDTTYIKLVIFGKKPKTDLSDANCDGKVSMLDVGQTKLIILGKEKNLWYINRLGEPRSVSKPVERIVVWYYTNADAIRILGAKDRIVGTAHMYAFMTESAAYYPDLSKLPYLGELEDVEALIDMDPDAVIGTGSRSNLEDKLKDTGIDVVGMESAGLGYMFDPIMTLGYILDEEENAREFIEWHDKYVDMIKEKVSEIPEDEKQRVFWMSSHQLGKSSLGTWAGEKGDLSEMVGVANIAAGIPFEGYGLTVEWEWVLSQNPDVIICRGNIGEGYSTDDISAIKAKYDAIMEMPGIENIAAGKNDGVFVLDMLTRGPGYFITVPYTAKWLHPELFEDLDPQEVHQEYIDRFMRIDFDVREHGVFVYPPIEEWQQQKALFLW